MPRIRIEYVPFDIEMPQDNLLLNEERKDELKFDEKIVNYVYRLKRAISQRVAESAALIQGLILQKNQLTQVFETMQ